jgi:hypothetical protein
VILDPLSIATIGYVAPVTTTVRGPLPLAIGSHGYIVIEVAGGERLADPRSGFDGEYWRRKYRKELERRQLLQTPRGAVKPKPKPIPINVLPEALAERRELARIDALENQELERLQEQAREDLAVQIQGAEVAGIEARGLALDRDILELEAYIRETAYGIETGLAAQIAAVELRADQHEAFLARLAENLIDARETLLAALERRRRHQNQLAAIEATIRYYF